jgi:hypothetical protein
VISTKDFYGTLIIENCVFTSFSQLTSVLWRIADTVGARMNINKTIVDGITWHKDRVAEFIGPNSFFFGDRIKIQNVERLEGGNLITHNLEYDQTAAFRECEFTNVCVEYILLPSFLIHLL